MPEKINEIVSSWWPTLMIALAAVSGLIGGCGVGIRQELNNKLDFRWVVVFAYGFVGLTNSLIGLAFAAYLVGLDGMTTQRVIIGAFIFGYATTLALAAQKYGTRVTLRWRGIEISMTAKEVEDEHKPTTPVK